MSATASQVLISSFFEDQINEFLRYYKELPDLQ